MATPTITPDAGAAPATPATPATPSTPATPVHSSDRALANFTSNDPDKGGKAAPAAASPATPATPVVDPAAPAVTPDLASVLDAYIEPAVDPTKPVVDPAVPVVDSADDPLAALKDNPRVIELQAHEAAVKDAMSASPEWIKEPAHLKAAVQDAAVLWDITTGKAKVDAILDAAKESSPQIFQQILTDLRTYLTKETGVPIAAAAAGQDPATMTEDQKRIAALEKSIADGQKAESDRKASEAQAAQVKRVTTTKTAVMAKVTELLKDTVFEGEAERFYELTGPIIGRDKIPQLIDAVEKGDFKLIEMAIKKAQSAESVRLKTIITRLIELQKKKGATIPKQGSSNSPAAGTDPTAPVTAINRDQRIKNMADSLKTGAQ